MHVHDCRGCGEPIFSAWCTAPQSRWRAFDREPVEPDPADELWVSTLAGMRRWLPRRTNVPAFYEHDCPRGFTVDMQRPEVTSTP